MTGRGRRRRAVLLLALALACGGLAAAEVGSRVSEVESAVGAPVRLLVTARQLPAGTPLRRADLAVQEVPERFVPPDALTEPSDAVGLPPAAALAEGSYLTAGVLAPEVDEESGPGLGAGALRRGQRAVEVAVAGGEALGAAGPGARVDVLVSTDSGAAAARTFLALEDVELLALRAAGGGGAAGAAGGGATAVATMRVTLPQAVYLTAAQNFAREVRLLPRPPGDRRRAGRATVAADAL